MAGTLSLLICLAALTAQASAATYYVSPTGSSGNPGTAGSPWSLSHANATLNPGDTAILLDGTYTTGIAPARSGTAGNPITYQAQNSRLAELTTSNPRLQLTSRHYITVDGMKAYDGWRYVIGNYGSHLTINDCDFRLFNKSSFETGRFRNSGGYITVTNSHIEDGNDSLHIREGSNHYIAGNTFIKDSHTLLILMGVTNSIVENNTLYNAAQKCMEVFSLRQAMPPSQVVSEYNLIQNNQFRSGSSSGIQYGGNRSIIRRNVFDQSVRGMAWSGYGGTDPGDDPEAWWDEENRFYNNTLYNNSYPIHAAPLSRVWPLGGSFGDNVHVNNIIYKGGSALVFLEWDGVPTHLLMFNNSLLRTSPGQDVIWWGDKPGTDDYYTVAEIESAYPANYADNVEYDPQFTNAAADDFTLQPTSPCIDAGAPLTTATEAGSGTVVPVADALYFTDGYGVIAADTIFVGSQRVTIVSVNYASNQLTIDRSISWSTNAPIYTDYTGAAPDLGAFENATPPMVTGRYVFYNNSAWDGNDPAANVADDAAIATNKFALLPGETASFPNYTSYWRGINGIMVDIANALSTPTLADFAFKVGNVSNLSGFTTAPTPTGFAVRPGEGVDGSDRVTIIFADGAIVGKWLQVAHNPTSDVFYFGSAIGETGNSVTDAEVTPTDEIYVRNNSATLAVSSASISHAGDFNRDKKVGPTDAIICRNNGTNSSTALQLIAPFTNNPPTVGAGIDNAGIVDDPITLAGSAGDDGYPFGTLVTTWSKFSGPGSVLFGDANASDSSATFSAAGTYVLQLEADDGELATTDTVQYSITATTGGEFFDDFNDNNIDGWTTLAGSMATIQFSPDPGYEVYPLSNDSRITTPIDNSGLADTVYISCKIRHTSTSSGLGWKQGRLWLVDSSGAGFGLYFALDQNGDGSLSISETTDNGASETYDPDNFSFGTPGDPNGTAKKTIELVYDRVGNTIECFYEGVSKGTLSVDASYADFNRVVIYLKTGYDGSSGRQDIDDIRIANTPLSP